MGGVIKYYSIFRCVNCVCISRCVCVCLCMCVCLNFHYATAKHLPEQHVAEEKNNKMDTTDCQQLLLYTIEFKDSYSDGNDLTLCYLWVAPKLRHRGQNITSTNYKVNLNKGLKTQN